MIEDRTGEGTTPGPMRGWLNELVLVPLLTLALAAPTFALVLVLGRYVSPRFGAGEPLGTSLLLVGFFGAYVFAVRIVRGRHRRIHGRYP